MAACGGGGNSGSGGGNNNNPTTISVSITPTVSVRVGETRAISVTTQNTDFTVSVDPASGSGCQKNGADIICAPTASGTYTLTVTATADTTKKATATVTVPELEIIGAASQTLYADEAESGAITFNAGGNWTAVVEGDPSWIELSAAVGPPGDNRITATLQPNDTNAERVATIMITTAGGAKTVTITQTYVTENGTPYGTPGAVTISISPAEWTMELGESKVFPVVAENTGFTVLSAPAAGCAISGDSVTCNPTEAGTYEITVTATANTTKTSTAVLTVKAPPAPATISISPTELTIALGERATFSVVAENTRFMVGTTPCVNIGSELFCDPAEMGTYMIGVQAYNGDMATAVLTVTAPLIPDTEKPTVPRNLTATATSWGIDSSWIDLGWEPSTDNVGVTRYRIYRDGAYYGASYNYFSLPSPSFSDNVLALTEYCYQVSAVDGVGNESDKSPSVCVTAIPDTEKPTVPGNLTATVLAKRIDLSWEPSTDTGGVAGYKIYRNGTAIWYQKASIMTYYIDTNVQVSAEYCYQVSAVDNAGNESEKSPAVCATASSTVPIPDTPPTTPTSLTATVVSATQINLAWDAAQDMNKGGAITVYNLYKDGADTPFVSVNASALFFNDEGLVASTEYCYQVSAVDNTGNESEKSPSVCATTPWTNFPAPQNLTVTYPTNTDYVQLSWSVVTDATNGTVDRYVIYCYNDIFVNLWRVARNSDGSDGYQKFTETEGRVSFGWTDWGNMCFQVAAIDAEGNESGKSAKVCK